MSAFLEVCLVDGFGRPCVLVLKDTGVRVDTIEYPHEGVKTVPPCMVQFDRTDEIFDGRPVFRMRALPKPPIRKGYIRAQG